MKNLKPLLLVLTLGTTAITTQAVNSTIIAAQQQVAGTTITES